MGGGGPWTFQKVQPTLREGGGCACGWTFKKSESIITRGGDGVVTLVLRLRSWPQANDLRVRSGVGFLTHVTKCPKGHTHISHSHTHTTHYTRHTLAIDRISTLTLARSRGRRARKSARASPCTNSAACALATGCSTHGAPSALLASRANLVIYCDLARKGDSIW